MDDLRKIVSLVKIDPEFIASIDKTISHMKLNGYPDKDIFKCLHQLAPAVLIMSQSVEPKQLELYTHAYDGFHTYLNIISSTHFI